MFQLLGIQLFKVLEQIQKKVSHLWHTQRQRWATEMRELTSQEQHLYDNASHCHLCQQSFEDLQSPEEEYLAQYEKWKSDKSLYKKRRLTSNLGPKVRNHNHFTGQYIGPAHSLCNLEDVDDYILPVLAHNGSKYDFKHFVAHAHLVKSIFPEFRILGKTMENFSTVELRPPKNSKKIPIILKDSMSFMAGSLDKLVQNLKEKVETNLSDNIEDVVRRQAKVFPHLWRYFEKKWIPRNVPKSSFLLLTQKGHFPYTTITNFEAFEQTSLPPQASFYNDFKEEHISKEGYQHAQQVWNNFQCANLGNYSDLYLELDTVSYLSLSISLSLSLIKQKV